MEKTEREHEPKRKQGEAKLLKYWRQGQVESYPTILNHKAAAASTLVRKL